MAPKMVPKAAKKAITKTITKTAPAQTKTILSQRQCLEMVQIMIYGSLSEIFFMRKFFPDYAYEKQDYQLSEQVHSYDDFTAGKILKDPDVDSSETAPLNVLRRNRSSRVDKFLSWLEDGVFPEIEAQNLNSLQVYVHPIRDRDKVLETYTLKISYSADRSGNQRALSGLEFESPEGDRFTFGSTSASIVFLFRRLIMLGHGLPELEDDDRDTGLETCISMALFYENGKNSSNHPAGFMGRHDGPISFAEVEGWETRAELIPNLRFGSQSAALQIAYLQRKDVSFNESAIEETRFVIPSELDFTCRVDPLEPIVKTRAWEALVKKSNSTGGRAIADASRTPSTINTDLETSNTLQLDDSEGLPISQLSQNLALLEQDQNQVSMQPQPTTDWNTNLLGSGLFESSDSLNTQSSNVPVMKRTVRAMVQPERMTQGDTQVPNIAQAPRSKTTASATPATDEDGIPDQDVVRCQCGDDKKDDDMIKCQSCNSLQHLHCYGYHDADDDRLPDDYACYECLFSETEQERLDRLRRLVWKRRAMHRAEKYGLTTMHAFEHEIRPGKKPAVSNAAARDIYKYLKDQGFVVHSGHPKKIAHFVAVKSGSDYEKMVKELRDPFIEISHKYTMPATYKTTKPALAQKVLESPSTMMPPPMTPSSRFLPGPSTSSRTDLGRPKKLQPDQTPSRPPSFRVSTSKRSRQAGDDGGQAQKRRASSNGENVSNSQTEFFLDTSAQASSPAAISTPAGLLHH